MRENVDSWTEGAATADGDGSIHLREYLRILVRRRTVILTCVAAVVLVTAALVLFATPLYQATATVQIERQGPDVLTFRDVLSVDSAGYHDYYQTQFRILQSRAVLRKAVDRLDLPNHPDFTRKKRSPLARILAAIRGGGPADSDSERATDVLSAGLSVRPIPKSHLVRVSFVHSDPHVARDVANAVVEAYRQFHLDARYTTTAQASEFLTQQVAKLQEEIAEKERRFQRYRAERGMVGGEGHDPDITAQSLAELNRQHSLADARLALAEARYESLLDADPDSIEAVMSSPLISRLRQSHAELERGARQMAERFGPEWPDRVRLELETGQAAARLELETERILRQVRQAAEADRNAARAEVRALGRRVSERKAEVQNAKAEAVEYASLQDEIEAKRKFLNELVGRQSETAVSDRLRGTRTSNVRVVDPARSPEAPIRPRKAFSLLLATVLGLLAGIGAAVLVEYLDYTVKDDAQIERLTRLPVLGRITLFRSLQPPAPGAVPDSRDIDLGSHLDPRSGFAESFKNLRTSILMSSPDRAPRRIVVTSAEPGDGKSTVSTNLAIALAHDGRRVLLVDADLRRPRLHRVMRVENVAGLSSILTGNAEIDECVHSTDIDNLRFLSSGPIPPTPSELIGSPSLDALLDRLSESYDHVILDSAPALLVADTVILAARADATMTVVRIGKTSRESLTLAVRRLQRARANVVGTVLNAVADEPGYYYGEGHADRKPSSRRSEKRLAAAGRSGSS